MRNLTFLRRPRVLISLVLVMAVSALGIFFGPMAFSGPRIVAITPADASQLVSPKKPIRIEFDQWINQASVLAAISLDPPAAFDAQWERSAVTLLPKGGLHHGQQYRLNIQPGVRNLLGRASQQAQTVAFATMPYVAVTRFTPGQQSSDVALRTPITVEFDQPIVTAEVIASAAEDLRLADSLPQPLVLDPATIGVGRWLSPTLYGFYPGSELLPGMSYTATVLSEISADIHMEQPVAWNFQTETPLLLNARPYDGAAEVPAQAPIEVKLAAGVDLSSAGTHFALQRVDTGAVVSGNIQPAEQGFQFVPAAALERGVRYEAQLTPGIQSIAGTRLNARPLTWSFTVIGDLAVDQVAPTAGATEVVTTTQRISVRFNHPVVALTSIAAQASLPQPLTINPPLAGVGRWLDTSTYIYSPTTAFNPSTTYQVLIKSGLQDQTGGSLKTGYSWDFRTILPQVISSAPEAKEQHASPVAPLTLVFNQPMSKASLQGALSLTHAATQASVPGELRVSGATATFIPARALERGQNYTLAVGAGAQTASGAGALEKPYQAAFRVAPLPGFVRSSPANGAVMEGGHIELTFTTPLNWNSLERNLTIVPKPTEAYTFTNGTSFGLNFGAEPEADYKVTIGAASSDPYGVKLGADTVITFKTAPLRPQLSIVGASQIASHNAHAPTRLSISQVNLTSLNYDLYSADQAAVARFLTSYQPWEQFKPSKLLTSKRVAIEGQRNEEEIESVDLGKLEPGLYYVRLQAGSEWDRQLLAVSPYALTIKRTPTTLFVWAVDLASGKPVANLPISAQAGVDSEPQTLGQTNSDGVLSAPFTTPDLYDPVMVWSAAGPQFSFATTNWAEGINAWNFGLPTEYTPTRLVGNFATDRPIYRPDQVVALRGSLRLIERDQYQVPPSSRRANFTISDPQGTIVLSNSLPLSEFGTFSTSLRLSKSAAVGNYSLSATLDGTKDSGIYGSFIVAEYRKPVFELTVTPATPDLVIGNPLSMQVSAQYFSGGAVANAPVRWRLMRQPLFFDSASAPNFSFQDLEDPYAFYRWDASATNSTGSRLIAEGTATTDGQGNLTLTPKIDLGTAQGSQKLTLDVEVSDIDGQVIAGQGAVNLHAGDYYIGLRPEGYIGEVGQPQQVAVLTLTPQDQPLAKQPVEVGIYQHEWFSVREQGSDGRMYWTSRYTDTLVETRPVTTDAQGRASLSFTPKAGGSYRIKATGRDQAGHTIKSSAFTWVYGGDVFWGVNATNRIDLIADKTSYKPGETASILVPAPYKGMTALLTIERGEVLEHRVLTLQGTTELIEIPITAQHAPNIYASLTLIKPAGADLPVPDMRSGLINLAVSTEQQELTVTITPDQAEAGPGDEITYTIKATDYQGKGVKSEVAVGLVDKAVLSLADDSNPTLRSSFYGKRPLGVFTANSLTALVDRNALRGNPKSKGGGGGQAAAMLVRSNVPDTAYWNPALLTNQDGLAQVKVTLPDNLTTWRMTARSLSAATQVGQGTQDLVASKPLLIRPTLPRFLTVGDQVVLQAVVQNTTTSPIKATVTLQPGLLKLSTAAEQTSEIPANGRVVVQWSAEVPTAGKTTLLFRVDGGGLQDAIEQTLPIQRFLTPEVVASAGQVQSSPVVETLKIPAAALPASGPPQGELTLELVPSLAAGVQSGLEYLRHYAYECTEQTVSRFLPNAVSYRLFKELGVADPQLKAGLEDQLGSGLQRLYALQHLDGGWGWWSGDKSHPYLSAYAIQGLLEARKAGYSIDEQVFSQGLDYIRGTLDGALLDNDLNTRAFILFVLAESGNPDQGRTVALYERRAELSTYARAYLLMTLHSLNPAEPRVKTLASDLMGSALLNPTTAHWEERVNDTWTMSSDTRTTALALQALVRSDPNNFLVPNAVRYLMTLRNQGHWETTQETAITLIALSEYIAASGELEGNYRYQVLLDEQILKDGNVNRENLDKAINITTDLAQLKLDSGSQLVLQRPDQGKGRLYYTLRMRYYQDAADVQALDQGVSLQREYVAVDTQTFSPTGQLITQAKLGDVVQVHLTIQVPTNMQYFVVEDMLPAGLEALDTSLKTVSSAVQEPQERTTSGERAYWSYFTQSEIRDNRVALFATDLAKGTYHYTYLARASSIGTFQTLPATAYQMYQPEVFGRSAGARFVVEQ